MTEVHSALAALVAMCTTHLQKRVMGGLVVGVLNIGGSIDAIHNAVSVAELAVENGPTISLMPVSTCKQSCDLSDDRVTKVKILFYSDAREAFIKARRGITASEWS